MIGYYSFFLIGYKLSTQQLEAIFFNIYLFILFNIANSKENYLGVVGFSAYNTFNTILKRIIIFIIVFLMILFNLLLLQNIKIPIITTIGSNTLYIYLFHDYFIKF